MEKLCYLWWADGDVDALGPPAELARELASSGVHAPVVHAVLDPPEGAPRAVITAWIDCHDRRTSAEEHLAAKGGRLAGYLVTESVYIDRPGESTTSGASRLALLERPAAADEPGWLDRWPGALVETLEGTDITRYARNVVARALTPGAPPYFLLIEERWPTHHAAAPPVDEHAPLVLEADEHRAPGSDAS